jgi:GTP:adenosylcobinamide-phosphate guanylyltransferase
MSGRDKNIKREIMQVLDPEDNYKGKCLLPFLGKPVAQWVVDELVKSKHVEGIYSLGISREDLDFGEAVEYIPVDFFADLSEKYVVGYEYLKARGKTFDEYAICMADTPAITVEKIDEFLKAVMEMRGYDFILSVVPYELCQREFSEAGRVTGDFTDCQIFPGEMFTLSKKAILEGEQIIADISRLRRKRSFWAVAWYVFRRPATWTRLFKLVLRRAKLKDAVIVLERAFKMKMGTVLIEDLGFGLDMDVSQNYQQLENYMKKTKLAKTHKS